MEAKPMNILGIVLFVVLLYCLYNWYQSRNSYNDLDGKCSGSCPNENCGQTDCDKYTTSKDDKDKFQTYSLVLLVAFMVFMYYYYQDENNTVAAPAASSDKSSPVAAK